MILKRYRVPLQTHAFSARRRTVFAVSSGGLLRAGVEKESRNRKNTSPCFATKEKRGSSRFDG